jgi:hypothetical protein
MIAFARAWGLRALGGKVFATSSPRSVDQVTDLPALLLICAIASFVSLCMTGCVLGVRNDLYFLPIVRALYDQPQFAHDAYIQSLRYYASGPWMLLSGVARKADVSILFLVFDYLSRLIAFVGFLLCGDLLRIRSTKDRSLFALLLCATALLRGQSLAGDGGIFINYFTHSEVANGLMLVLLYCTIRGLVLPAFLLEGAIFFDNAFMGVWGAVLVVAVLIGSRGYAGLSAKSWIIQISIGVICAMALSLPVVWNILRNPDFGQHLRFDYVHYLELFWPYHFIFRDIPLTDKLDYLCLVIMGSLAFVTLGRPARPFFAAFAGLLILYLVGILVPFLTHAPLLLNLHLLRVSSIIQILAVLGICALAVTWWSSSDPIKSDWLAPLLVLLIGVPIRMATIQPAIMLSAISVVILLARHPGVGQKLREWFEKIPIPKKGAALTLIVMGMAVVAIYNTINNAKAQGWIDEWTRLGQWARSSTPTDAEFLIPTWYFRGQVGRVVADSPEDIAVLNAPGFEAEAERRVWIDFRDGAAVMWSPSYYQEWFNRVEQVNSLRSHEEQLAYARANGINYVVVVCVNQAKVHAAFSTQHLCAFKVNG